MTITVEIPPEIEAEVAAQAKARGLELPAYVEHLIEGAVPTARPTPRSQSLEEFERSLDYIAQYSDKIPALPDEAFSRESIYQDHD